ncbi:site-specific integrase [Shigella flexneri]
MKQDLARIEQFLDALWLEKNLAQNTLNAYRRNLSMMVEWLHHRGLTLATAQAGHCRHTGRTAGGAGIKPPAQRVC